jgi:hypothetical protein
MDKRVKEPKALDTAGARTLLAHLRNHGGPRLGTFQLRITPEFAEPLP